MASAFLVLFALTLAAGGPRMLSAITAKTTPRVALFLLHGAVFTVLLTAFLVPVSLVADPSSLLGSASAGIAVCWEQITGAQHEILGVIGLLIPSAVLLYALLHGFRTYYRDRKTAAQHSALLRAVGKPTSGPQPYRTVLLASDATAAYCLQGNPSTIVVSAGLREKLTVSEYHAVLAHEAAHLRGYHHALRAAWATLACTLPFVPLLTWASREVDHLLETRADEIAASQHGARTVASALITVATSHATAPASALAATGGRLTDRVRRLHEPRTTSPATLVGAAALPVAMLLLTLPLAATSLLCELVVAHL